jgi:hypothetical protein
MKVFIRITLLLQFIALIPSYVVAEEPKSESPELRKQQIVALPITNLYQVQCKLPETKPQRTENGIQFNRETSFKVYSCTGGPIEYTLVWQNITETHPFDDKYSMPCVSLFLHVLRFTNGDHEVINSIPFHREYWLHTKHDFIDLNNDGIVEFISHYWSGGKLNRYLVVCSIDGEFKPAEFDSSTYYRITDFGCDGVYEVVDHKFFFPPNHSFSERVEFPEFFRYENGSFVKHSHHFKSFYLRMFNEYQYKLSNTPDNDRFKRLYSQIVRECQERLK